MENFKRLLALEDSRLAWILRLGLQGLQVQLEQALQSENSDLGTIICQELIEELDSLLSSKNLGKNSYSGDKINYPEHNPNDNLNEINISDINEINHPDTIVYSVSTWEDALEPIIENTKKETIDKFQLQNIIEALQTDKELSQYIGEYKFHSSSDEELWNEIQRLLLRIPEKQAQIWRDRTLKLAAELGAIADHKVYKQLPFNRCEIMYPGLIGTINSTGLCLSDRIPISSQLVTENTPEELKFLAGVVSTCIKFIHIDTSLHHALKSVDRFGVRSLNSDSERSKYATALLERFHRVQITTNQVTTNQITTNQADPIAALRARLDLDEAIHSLVYLPPCDRYSWWGKLQQESRRTLDIAIERVRNTGNQIQIRPLWGTYADIYAYSKDDLLLDVGGIPGEVSACLRVYAKINDEVLPGRVLFRSS
ncbi:hypothetical protein [Brunnivagina elsteri]|uniref:Uncharacterized protein n=1 Tax=Brunnivagina elsteri CCALA 953 TaxID=987040 RepID=A0A2A2TPP9_9CYAN|nr:hypothetical protein [Calothrix elsteri]PAX60491.1 hypothetical protein CK510_01695 [Calothrix elsteri CCALA 953]